MLHNVSLIIYDVAFTLVNNVSTNIAISNAIMCQSVPGPPVSQLSQTTVQTAIKLLPLIVVLHTCMCKFMQFSATVLIYKIIKITKHCKLYKTKMFMNPTVCVGVMESVSEHCGKWILGTPVQASLTAPTLHVQSVI